MLKFIRKDLRFVQSTLLWYPIKCKSTAMLSMTRNSLGALYRIPGINKKCIIFNKNRKIIFIISVLIFEIKRHFIRNFLFYFRFSIWLVASIIFFGNIIPAYYLSIVHQRGTLDVMKPLRETALKNPKNTSLLFLMPCHSTPLYRCVYMFFV